MLMSYENDRRTLANRAHEVLGDEAGETLMEHLPHGGYAHVATKDDLRVLSAELRKEISDSARRQIIAVFGLIAAQTALIMSVIR
jgi:phage tail tape-measure protein